MSVTPGPVAMPSSIVNGRSAAVPGSNTVSMWPMQSRARAIRVGAVDLRDDRVAEAELVGVRRHRRPEGPEPVRRPGADRVDAGLRVAAAVDVDEALEVGEVGGQGGVERRRSAASSAGGRARRVSAWPKSIERLRAPALALRSAPDLRSTGRRTSCAKPHPLLHSCGEWPGPGRPETRTNSHGSDRWRQQGRTPGGPEVTGRITGRLPRSSHAQRPGHGHTRVIGRLPCIRSTNTRPGVDTAAAKKD